jgi:hypothetical protein
MKMIPFAIVAILLFAVSPLRAQDAPVQGGITRAPWITDQGPFEAMCAHDKARAFLTFPDQEGCSSAIRASASHCDRVLTADFSKYEGAPDFESRRSFFQGAARGCFMAQMNGRTSGKFVQLLQLMARSRKP